MKKFAFFIILIFISICQIKSKVWNIGSAREYKFCSMISNLVSEGDTIAIDSGFYDNDEQVTWKSNNLLIYGHNGKPILNAGSKISNDYTNGKGIFVVKGNNTTIENIEFRNAKVPDHNGAGIRLEGSNLTVRHCRFNSNEMGILAGGTIPNCKIIVEYCEFLNNGSSDNPGLQHNIYINHIDTFVFRFNFTYDARSEGHELKSRANFNYIAYNRISNINSTNSRNIDLPNGGTAIIIGNIIEQGENSANTNLIGFGLEGLRNPPPHNLYIFNNTIVNWKSRGSFVQVSNIDSLFLWNNIMVGAKTGGLIEGSYKFLDSATNFINNNIFSPLFEDVQQRKYRLSQISPLIDAGTIPNIQEINDYALIPEYEYIDTTKSKARIIQNRIDIGAYEFIDATSSVSDPIQKNDLQAQIIQNLTNDILTIKLNKIENETNTLWFRIYNNLGQEIQHQKTYEMEPIKETMGSIVINISNFPNGIYHLFLYHNGKIILNRAFIKI